MKPETIARLRSEAVAYAAEIVEGADSLEVAELTATLLRSAFMRGADAGYIARRAEEREP